MRRILSSLLFLTWSLWFGGLIALFMVVSSLFKTFQYRHDYAGLAASRIFHLFNMYDLALGAIALILAVPYDNWSIPRRKTLIMACLAIAYAASLVGTFRLTPAIERMRISGQTHSKPFAQLHGLSMGVYSTEALFLLIGGMMMFDVRQKP